MDRSGRYFDLESRVLTSALRKEIRVWGAAGVGCVYECLCDSIVRRYVCRDVCMRQEEKKGGGRVQGFVKQEVWHHAWVLI